MVKRTYAYCMTVQPGCCAITAVHNFQLLRITLIAFEALSTMTVSSTSAPM